MKLGIESRPINMIESASVVETNEPPVLSVSEISSAIKKLLESKFPYVLIQGEISNFKPHSSGHLYFSLKDAGAQISAVMFRPSATLIKVLPKEGAKVLVKGEINVFPQSGKYQIIVKELRPLGLGELLLKLEELKIKLHQMGWFKAERKRPLPKFPKTIGVVTSPTGAAIHDMLRILSTRFPNFHLILNPVKVQGDGAAIEIAKAIEQFNEYQLADVLIIGRGGGSVEDLWAFNEEIVAEAIFRSKIPTVSAVGHETDHCIADYVADVRAPTPSAAAEIVICKKAESLQTLKAIKERLQQCVTSLIRQDRLRLQGISRHPFFRSPFALLGPWVQQLDGMRNTLDEVLCNRLKSQRMYIESKKEILKSLNPIAYIRQSWHRLTIIESSIMLASKNKLKNLGTSLQNTKERIDHQIKGKIAKERAIFQGEAKYQQMDFLALRHIALKKEHLLKIRQSLDAVNPQNLLQKGYCILYREENMQPITSVKRVSLKEDLCIRMSDGSVIATPKDVY